MIFRDHCRRDCRARYPDEPREHIERASDKIGEWFERNPHGTQAECRAAMEADGSILVSLTILLVLIEIVYYLNRWRRERKGDSDE